MIALVNVYVFEITHRPMPAQTKVIPIQVSLVMTLPSASHSPSTVNKKARLFVIGTVRDNSENSVSFKFHDKDIRWASPPGYSEYGDADQVQKDPSQCFMLQIEKVGLTSLSNE